MVYISGFIYALRGDASEDFWRYNVAADSWRSLDNTPEDVAWGGALAWDGSNTIYAFRGANQENFWFYSISGDNWSLLEDAPADVRRGDIVPRRWLRLRVPG